MQQHADVLLRTYTARNPLARHPSMRALADWLEDESESDVNLFEYDDFFFGVHADSFERAGLDFTDAGLRTYEGFADDDPIDDEMRVAYMASQLESCVENGQGERYLPVFQTLAIAGTDGTTAVLAYGVTGFSFTGLTVQWFGVFADQPAFERWLEARGWITSVEDFAERRREDQMKYWRR